MVFKISCFKNKLILFMSLYGGKVKIKKQISSEVVQNSQQGLERYIFDSFRFSNQGVLHVSLLSTASVRRY